MGKHTESRSKDKPSGSPKPKPPQSEQSPRPQGPRSTLNPGTRMEAPPVPPRPSRKEPRKEDNRED
jgi:hypothetical protein